MHISLLKLFPLILFFVLLPIFSSQILDLSEINKENENQYYNDSILDEMPNFEDEDPAPNEDINPSKEPDSDEDEEDDADDRSIMKEWEEYMRDFVPADMLTYEIEGNKKEYFFEDIHEIPSYIRGAYFVSSEDKGKLDFYIIDPRNHTLQTKLDKKEGLFYFNATKKGVYSFIFSNEKANIKKQITFAIHCGNSTEQVLKNEHLSPLQSRILSIENKINDLTLETKFSNKRQDSHYKSLRNANQKILMFSLFETAAIFIAVFWQVYYIEKLLDNRRIV